MSVKYQIMLISFLRCLSFAVSAVFLLTLFVASVKVTCIFQMSWMIVHMSI